MLRRLALALVLSSALIAPTRAEPVTAALFGTAFAGSLGGAVVTTALQIGAGIGLNFAVNALTSRSQSSSATAAATQQDPREVTYGEQVPVNGVIGIAEVGGQFAHYSEYANATKAQIVWLLATGWNEDLVAVKVDGVRKTLVAQTVAGSEHKRYFVDGYDDLIDIRFHDGRPGQAADTELLAYSSGWTANHKFSHQCHVVVTVTSNRDKFSGQIPKFGWVLKGNRWYDRRKDTTAGGSGTHRFDDPTTWEWTANPDVAADHLARGYFCNGVRVMGGQMPVSELDAASIVAAQNVCDQTVTRPDGGTRARYEGHFAFDDTLSARALLERCCACAAGKLANMGGQLGFFAGAAQSSVMTLTDDDFVDDEDLVFSPHKTGDAHYSAVHGTYTRADDDALATYTSISSTTFATNDGRKRDVARNFPDVRDPHQACLMASIDLYGSRLDATLVGTLDIKDLMLQVGDWVDYESDHPLRGDRTFRCVGMGLDLEAARMRPVFEETSASVYADTVTEADIEEPARVPGVFGYLTAASNVSCDGASKTGGDGSVLPALAFAYDGIADAAVSAVLFQYRIKTGPGTTITDRDDSPGDGYFLADKGVAADQLYEFRHKLETLPGRAVDWSGWADADSATPGVEVSVSTADFAPEFAAAQQYVARMIGELEEYLHSLGNTVAQMDASTRTELVAKYQSTVAAVVTEARARADQYGSLAEAITAVVAQYNDVSASGLFSMVAEAAPTGYEVKITLAARLTSGGTAYTAGLYILLDDEGNSTLVLDFDTTVCRGQQVSLNGVRTEDWDTGFYEVIVVPD